MDAMEPFQRNPYLTWQRNQNIPIHTGYHVEDLRKLQLGFWQERNANGAFVNLSNAQVNDAYVLEVPRGEKTSARRQLFDESIMIIAGHGATSVWYDKDRKRSFEWQEGSVFAIPPNAWHEHYAMDSAARLVAVTSAPLYMQLFNNNDYIFNNDYQFTERFAAEENYFDGSFSFRPGFNGVETNFIADVRPFFTKENAAKIDEAVAQPLKNKDRAHDMFAIRVRFARTMMMLHFSGWAPGTYKKAHRHGPGFNIVIIDGEGYSLMWEEGKPKERIDWHEYSLFVPPMMWFHQHFSTSPKPIRFVAFHPPGMLAFPGWSGEGSHFIGKGANQIEYFDEDPGIRRLFEEELASKGLKSNMPQEIYLKQKV